MNNEGLTLTLFDDYPLEQSVEAGYDKAFRWAKLIFI
jgi:hypothetical protein